MTLIMDRINISTAKHQSVSTMRFPEGMKVVEFAQTDQGDLVLEVAREDYLPLIQMLTSQLTWEGKNELAEELKQEAMEQEFEGSFDDY